MSVWEKIKSVFSSGGQPIDFVEQNKQILAQFQDFNKSIGTSEDMDAAMQRNSELLRQEGSGR